MVKWRLSIVCRVSVLLALALSPAALADPSWAKVNATLDSVTYSSNISLSWTTPPCFSGASVKDSLGNSAAWGDLGIWNSGANVTIFDAHARGSTYGLTLSSISEATPPPGVSSHAWTGSTSGDSVWVTRDFSVLSPGEVSFSATLDYEIELMTTALGDTAGGEVYAAMSISSGSNNSDSWQKLIQLYVSDGDVVDISAIRDLSTTLYLKAGDTGAFSLHLWTDASATSVVPVPAAVLLGFLGLSTAGLGLRKLA
jgi:hypothetical protein